MTGYYDPRLGGDQGGQGSAPMLRLSVWVDQALAILRDPNSLEAARQAAGDSLARLGEAAAPHLLDLLHDPDHAIRKAAARALGYHFDRRSIGRLVRSAAWTASQLEEGGYEAYTRLMDALMIGTDASRAASAVALGRWGDSAALPELIETMGHRSRLPRLAAIHSLGLLGDRAALPHLQDALDDPDGLIQMVAREALGRIRTRDSGLGDQEGLAEP